MMIPHEIGTDARLTKAEIRVLLAMYANVDGIICPVWPSFEFVTEFTGYSRDKISATTAGLIQKGWVVIENGKYRVTCPFEDVGELQCA